jgi:diguanylate cyclase (GGDEF)-like protein
VARSWDARVRGASQKTTVAIEATDVVDDAPNTASSTERADRTAETPQRRATDPGPDGSAPAEPEGGPVAGRRTLDAELVAEGLSLAVGAADLAIAIAERSTGLIRWTSDAWIERFGERDLLARHMPTATELGEAPLPGPGIAWQRTRTLILADGAERLADLLMVGGEAKDGTAFVTVVALESVAGRHVVTGRSEVIDVIDGAITERDEGTVAVLYVDLDRFKVVHDLVGNVDALRLLDLVNQRLAGTVRGSDLLFRLHSDEYVIVASELEHPGQATELAERVRTAVATLSDVGHNMALTASIGVAIATDSQSGDQLLSAAETAVYVAKGRGRNRVAVHDEDVRSRSERLMVVERQLRQAIDLKDVRFAYQPVIELQSGAVVGAEALLRLGGDIGLSALEVVGAAEHSGLMGSLGVLVLEGVDDQLGSFLRSSGDNQSIQVNMSATQLADEDLVRTLARFSGDVDITEGRIALEIPEVVVRDHRPAVEALAKMVRPRFLFGIDGYGTGAITEADLEGLNIDYLKLHRGITTSLGRMAPGERRDVELLVAHMARRDVEVIGLGVESHEQADWLMDIGVHRAQGFLYAGAVTVERLLDLFETGVELEQQRSTS